LAAGTAIAVLGGQALAGGAGRPAVTIASGSFAGYSWSVEVQGGNDQRCYEVSLTGKSSAGVRGVCTIDALRPPLWSRLVAVGQENATVELAVTRLRVRSMRLRIGHTESRHGARWVHLRNRRLTPGQADQADVRRDFRYAVLRSRGTFCVQKAILFNREHDRIAKLHTPCEFPR